MEINHDIENKIMVITNDDNKAYVKYELRNGTLDIIHTIVPSSLGHQGIASSLVKAAYDYAINEGLKPAATCPYAKAWLEKHPEYRN
jgi:uncharacterized protein